jgi:hypothetical protein
MRAARARQCARLPADEKLMPRASIEDEDGI